MRRREFITLISGAAIGWPLGLRAQQTDRVRKIGVLFALPPNDARFAEFRRGLQELGWIEGKNVALEIRHARGDQLRAQTVELVQANVDVIVVNNAGIAAAVRSVTTTIPIVAASAGQLEGTGLIASLQRPGTNVTGSQILSPELMSKRVELLKQLVPSLARLAVVEPVTPTGMVMNRYYEVISDAASVLGIGVQQVQVHTPAEFPAAFMHAREGAQAALVIANPLSTANRKDVVAAAAQSRLPTIYEVREFVADGGLLSYGPNLVPLYRDAASYIDKILKGASVGELPVQQPTKFELVINLKTAKALGLTIPPLLLARADEVIE